VGTNGISRVPIGAEIEGSIRGKRRKAENACVCGARSEYEMRGTMRRTATKNIVPIELPPYCPRNGKKSMGSSAALVSLEAITDSGSKRIGLQRVKKQIGKKLRKGTTTYTISKQNQSGQVDTGVEIAWVDDV